MIIGKGKKGAAVWLCLCLYLASCAPKQRGPGPGESFTKIYNRTDTSTYNALDIKQNPDGGYTVLGQVDDHPYLLRVDQSGDFLWDTKNEGTFDRYTNPVPGLLPANQAYYFFCSGTTGAGEAPILLKIGENRVVTEVTTISYTNYYEDWGLPYAVTPKHASIIGESDYLLITVNNMGDAVIFVGDGNGNGNRWYEQVNDRLYWAGWICLTSYPSTSRMIHYTGVLKGKGKHYFHTYRQNDYNVNLSDCFKVEMEAPDGDGSEPHPQFNIDRPLVAMEWDDSQWDVSQWNGMRLSGAYINRNEHNNIISLFVNARIIMDEETKQGRVEANEEYEQSELNASRPVYIKTIRVVDRDIVFFSGGTGFDRIVLYAYDLSAGRFLGKEYYGEKRLYEAAGLIGTGDGGLAILGNTYVMDLQKRICLFKLSKAEVEAVAGFSSPTAAAL